MKNRKKMATRMSQMIIVDEDINVNEVDIYNIVKDVCGIKEKFEDMIASDKHRKYSKPSSFEMEVT
jgi:hypothetical protein